MSLPTMVAQGAQHQARLRQFIKQYSATAYSAGAHGRCRHWLLEDKGAPVALVIDASRSSEIEATIQTEIAKAPAAASPSPAQPKGKAVKAAKK